MTIDTDIIMRVSSSKPLANDAYDMIEQACIDSGCNYSEIDVYSDYEIRVYFDTQEDCHNAQVTLEALKGLEL